MIELENPTNIYKDLNDEILKLYILVAHNPGQTFNGDYLAEKILKAVHGIPIILHPSLVPLYKQVKDSEAKKNASFEASNPY